MLFTLKSRLQFLSLDLRSLALGRVFIGLVLIVDWFYRITNSFDFYSDLGVLPRGPVITNFANPYFFSLFYVAGKPFYIYLLFIIALIFYLGFTFGYKTKISNLFTWIFFVSMSARTGVISHAGDDILRLALFWYMFLPAHRFFSIDQALLEAKNGPQNITNENTRLLNIASFALMFQLLLMYTVTAFLKWHPIWHTEGSAIYYALQLDQFLTPFGELFKMLPYRFHQIMTWLTLAAEFILPFLFFVPWKNNRLRWIMILSFIGFHLGLFSVFYLGFFPWICMAYWLVFIPSNFWDKLFLSWSKSQKFITIYYDPDCGICRRMCFLIRGLLVLPYINIEAGATPDIHKQILNNNSWLVRNNSTQTSYIQFDAFIHLVSESYLSPLTYILNVSLFKNIGNAIYETVAARRKKYIGWIAWFKIFKNPMLTAWPFQALAALFLVVVLWWNVVSIEDDSYDKIPKPIQIIGSIFRLHQQWSMFAPFPAMEDGWVITDGVLKNGEHWDVFNDRPVNFEMPRHMSDLFKNTMWRKYLINLRSNEYEKYRLYFGRYICRLWNDKHEGLQQVDTFKIYYMLDLSKPHGAPKAPLVQEMLWSHGCFID